MARVYLPEVVGGGYGAFWRCRRRYRVVKGGKASKKSSTAAIWFILHLMKMPGANLLVVRQVYRTHLDSTMPSSAGRSGACGGASLAGLQEPAGAHLPADRAADPVPGL